MARPRKFSEDDVLTCAMMTFWRLGFDATTMRELERLSGVGIRSLHNTFGDKDEMFARALAQYRGMVAGLLDQMFSEPGVETIARFFEGSAQPTETPEDPRNAGCLVVNSVFEIPQMPETAAAEIQAYRQMFIDRFRASLVADSIPEAEAKAEYLLGSLWGVLSQIRLAQDTRAAAPMAKIIAQTVRGWQREQA